MSLLNVDIARLKRDSSYRSQLHHVWRKEESIVALSALINKRCLDSQLLQKRLIDTGHAYIKSKDVQGMSMSVQKSKECTSTSVVCVRAESLVAIVNSAINEEEKELRTKREEASKLKMRIQERDEDEEDEEDDNQEEVDEEEDEEDDNEEEDNDDDHDDENYNDGGPARKKRRIETSTLEMMNEPYFNYTQSLRRIPLMRKNVKVTLSKIFKQELYLKKVSVEPGGPLFHVFRWDPELWMQSVGPIWHVRETLRHDVHSTTTPQLQVSPPTVLTGSSLSWLLQTRRPRFHQILDEAIEDITDDLANSSFPTSCEVESITPIALSQFFDF